MQEIIYNLKNKIRFLAHNFGRIILIIFFILIFLFGVYFYNNYFSSRVLKISFFDIGQGDSVMIETPSHKKVIIDAGPSDKVLGLVDNEVNLFSKNVDLAIMSHPDQDHIAGFISLFKKYDFKKVIWNGDDDKNTAVWDEIKKYLMLSIQNETQTLQLPKMEQNQNTNSIIANCGDEINFNDGVKIYILHSDLLPYPSQGGGETQSTDSNSKSM